MKRVFSRKNILMKKGIERMKTMKKLVALAVAFVMVLAMGVTSFADETPSTYPISIKAAKEGETADTHTYSVYQIFTGDLSDGKLSNVKWGANGTGTIGEDVSEEILTELSDVNGKSDTEKLAVIEKYFKADSTAVGTVTSDAAYNAAPGYYLIKDSGTLADADTYTKYIVQVVGPTEIKRKADVPEMDKKVQDKNDSTGAVTDWQDGSDYDIGDNVPYRITTTIVENYADYEHYYLEFSDTMEAGLDFNNDVEITVDNVKITEGFTTTPAADKHGFTVVFNDLKDVKTVHAGSKIVVTYSAKLNSAAKIGSEGNKNTAHMEFSNNPNSKEEGKPKTPGKTPDDTVITFTYKTVVDKYETVNNEKKPLPKAGFSLYKAIKDYEGTEDEVSVAGEGYKLIKKIDPSDATTFTFEGLDAGTYKLVESATPSGYNTIDPIEFTVTATYDTESNDPKLTGMTVSPSNKFTVEMTEGNAAPTGTIKADVENKSGSVLPSTGGMGTTIFYVVGAVLVLGAGVLLITRKRVSK